MVPYFILLAVVVLISHYSVRDKRQDIVQKNWATGLVTLLLILFAGLRSHTVGTDSGQYWYAFILASERSFTDFSGNHELGFEITKNVAALMSHQYWALYMLIAVMVVTLSIRTIRTLSEDFMISIFLFLTIGTYTFFFNGARQGIAIAFFTLSIVAVIQGSLKQYLLWVTIAFLFHKSAIICFPLYFLLRNGFNLKNVLMNSVILGILVLYVSSLIDVEDTEFSYYMGYLDRGMLGGGGFTAHSIVSFLVLLYVRPFMEEKYLKTFDVYLYMVFFGTVIFTATYFMQLDVNIMRLTSYFRIGYILVWPLVFTMKDIRKDLSIMSLFIGLHLFYFVMILGQAGLTPYKLNPFLF